MKKIILFMTFYFAVVCSAIAQAIDSLATSDNPITNLIPASWWGVVGMLIGGYEIIVRIYPTLKNYSIVHKAIEILQYLSKSANNIKKP